MRIRLCLLLFSLLLCPGIDAQQTAPPTPAKQTAPNTLSAKEIAEGWIQLFDGTTDYGWRQRGEAKWTITNGTLRCDVGQEGTLGTTTEFSDGELHFECMQAPGAEPGIALRAPAEAAIAPKNAAVFYLSNTPQQSNPDPRRRPRINGWNNYDLIANGGTVEFRHNGKTIGKFNGPYPLRGSIALMTDGKGSVQFRNIRFRPSGLKNVFNGKDLTGWMAPEGNKSVFTVTKEGWLNLKGGRGDLQTIEQWGDFVLQIDVYSNGDHLNSGVFFRAEAGKFEQGYEDQIRNEWQGDDRSKPVDYGTGAIYNRQPVRKVVSSDREWFTMTLVAHGNHFGSWVNGVLVCDFTDTRPPDQTNARKGARTKAGVISLQGHEPATDLNFRNIRIGELPAASK